MPLAGVIDVSSPTSPIGNVCDDEALFFGPSDWEVQSVVGFVTVMIHSVAASLDTDDLEIRIPLAKESSEHTDLFGSPAPRRLSPSDHQFITLLS